MTSSLDLLRRVLVACAPLLVWVLHFATLYGALSAVPAEATCVSRGVHLSVWLATAIAAVAIVVVTRYAVTWAASKGRELRLIRVAAATNAVLALIAVFWSVATVVLQARWCPG